MIPASKKVYDTGGKIAGMYDLQETIGRGHYAVVKLARHVFTGEKVAVKVIDKTKLDEAARASLFKEVRCMKLVQHPHIVRLYDVIDTQSKLYLILELGDGGDMYDHIMTHEQGLHERTALRYFRQILLAISYCHQLHVVHRDLKPENVVFFKKDGIVKLTDFGFSNKYRPDEKLDTSCGSLAYSAPEILLGDSYDAPAVDVWSLGVILFMLVAGRAPFHEANDSETLMMIMDCKYAVPDNISDECKDLIKRMLVREPSGRASIDEIIAHPWVGGQKALQECAQGYQSPLIVSKDQLSDEDHRLIVHKMVAGQVASMSEVLEALEKDEYGHITSTYYLLAEKHLKEEVRRLSGQGTRKPMLSRPVSSHTDIQPASPQSVLMLRHCSDPADGSSDKNEVKATRSLDGAKTVDTSNPATGSHNSSPRAPNQPKSQAVQFGSSTIFSYDLESASSSSSTSTPITRTTNSSSKNVSQRAPRALHPVKSSPTLLLKEISEEADDVDDNLPLVVSPTARLTRYEHRKKIMKSRSGSNCSSSDASDDEDTRKRKEKLKNIPRRDSHDDSSNDESCAGPHGGAGTGGSGGLGGGQGGGSGGFRSGGQGGDGGGGGSGGKSDSSYGRKNSLHRIAEIAEGALTGDVVGHMCSCSQESSANSKLRGSHPHHHHRSKRTASQLACVGVKESLPSIC